MRFVKTEVKTLSLNGHITYIAKKQFAQAQENIFIPTKKFLQHIHFCY